jgi:CPA2 family monovalent cation:H+ antiporter-2
LILAGAILSILLNPLVFVAADRLAAKGETAKPDRIAEEPPAGTPSRAPIPVTPLSDHVVLVGHGRVGSFITAQLSAQNTPLLVIEDNADATAELRRRGVHVITGNAADPEVIAAANLPAARCLLVALADAFEGGQAVEQARAINPALPIIARAHSEAESEHLKKFGATSVVMAEHEIGKTMIADIPPVSPAPSTGVSA